jgi:hypothetical protein
LDWRKAIEHVGHEIEIATYGPADEVWNVAIECMTCGTVIVDEDTDEDYAAT